MSTGQSFGHSISSKILLFRYAHAKLKNKQTKNNNKTKMETK